MFDTGSMVSKMGLDVSGFTKGMLTSTSMAQAFPAVVTGFIANPLLGLAETAKIVGNTVGAVFGQMSDAFKTGFGLAVDTEKAEVAFGVLLGSALKAKVVLKDLADFAASTPFEMPELVGATRNLLAFGIQQHALMGTMRMVGDVASAINQPIGEMAEIFGKAKVQGRLFMEDINQLTGRGVPIIGELARQFGVTEGEVRKLVETGRVGFGNLEQAFAALTGQGGRFAGMMQMQSGTFAGMWSTMKDNWNTLLKDLATPVMLALKPEMERLLSWFTVNSPFIADHVKMIGTELATMLGKAVQVGREGFAWLDQNKDGIRQLGVDLSAIAKTLGGEMFTSLRALGVIIKDMMEDLRSLDSLLKPLGGLATMGPGGLGGFGDLMSAFSGPPGSNGGAAGARQVLPPVTNVYQLAIKADESSSQVGAKIVQAARQVESAQRRHLNAELDRGRVESQFRRP